MHVVTTSSGREFHGFTSTAKLNFLIVTAVHVISTNDLLSVYYLITSVYLHKHQSHNDAGLSYRHVGVCSLT